MEKADAIVLLSGGLDSALMLAMLSKSGKKIMALSFDYGQRHKVELEYAKKLAGHYKALHRIFQIDPRAVASPLVSSASIPKDRTLVEIEQAGPSPTYVPARNTMFLSFALGQAEIRGAKEIHFGPNAHDKFGYPDCSPEYIAAFQNLLNIASPKGPKLAAPLIHMTKKEIREKAEELNVPIDLTFSCYDPTPEGRHCLRCDACAIRFSISASNETLPSYCTRPGR